MTDLRDRIAAVIARGYEPDHPAPNRHDYRAADSVIADLGLVVETTVRVVDHGAGEVRIPESRVVGRWVKNHADQIERDER